MYYLKSTWQFANFAVLQAAICLWASTGIATAEVPDPIDLVHVATKMEANRQKMTSLRGRYRLDSKSSAKTLYPSWKGEPTEYLIHDVVIDFAIAIADKPTLMATYDRLSDDILELSSGERVTVPNSRLSFISVVEDGDFRQCQIALPVGKKAGERTEGKGRVVTLDDRKQGLRRMDVTNPVDFYGQEGSSQWLRRIAKNDSVRKKFTMVKDGPLWSLSFAGKTPYGDEVILTSVFDARVGFNEVELHETIGGRTRSKRSVTYENSSGVFVPTEVVKESYTFGFAFQDLDRYTLESIEINPKLTDEDFGFAPFDLINGDTVYDNRTRTRTWHWNGEFISKEEYQKRSKAAAQKDSSADIGPPSARIAMIACTCILAIAATSLMRRRRGMEGSSDGMQ